MKAFEEKVNNVQKTLHNFGSPNSQLAENALLQGLDKFLCFDM